MRFQFQETPYFTRRITKLLTHDEYLELQNLLLDRPDVGDIIQGSGGLRKVRFGRQGTGKSGGVRVVYYWLIRKDVIFMLDVFAKNERSNLTQAQTAALRKLAQEIESLL